MVLLLLNEENIHTSLYDSAGPFHRNVSKEVGAISLLAFGLPLNGLGNQFSRISKESDYLLIHKDCADCMEKDTREELLHRLSEIKQVHKGLRIFATPLAVKELRLNGSTNILQSPEEIVEFIKSRKK